MTWVCKLRLLLFITGRINHEHSSCRLQGYLEFQPVRTRSDVPRNINLLATL